MNTWQKAMSWWQTKMILLVIALLGLGLWASIPSNTLAQGTASPTPTNIGVGGGGSGGGSESTRGTPVPAGAGVSGRVYNYSTNAYEGGVPVVMTGDGWQAETFTDSNGHYRFDGLGTGRGVVNLRLPPGTHPVVVDWPVWTYERADLNVDLGFYWGDTPPLPVLLSANLDGDALTVQVENFTSVAATGGMLEVETPGRITISPAVDVVQGGAAMAYDAHQTQLDVNNIPPGDQVLMYFTLTGASQFAEDDVARITFTYHQQYSPQVVIVGPNELQPVASARMMALEQSAGERAEQANVQATAQPEATPVPGSADASSESKADSEGAAASAEPTPLPQLPVTGTQTSTVSEGLLIFSMVFLVGLIGAGWWSVKSNNLARRDK